MGKARTRMAVMVFVVPPVGFVLIMFLTFKIDKLFAVLLAPFLVLLNEVMEHIHCPHCRSVIKPFSRRKIGSFAFNLWVPLPTKCFKCDNKL